MKKLKPKQKKIWLHKNQAQLERDYYNQNTKLAIQSNTIAHYSYDWSQNIQAPHFSQQPSQMYFLTARKVHLFGFQNEVTKEQTNYILDKHELLNKGSNGTLSLVFNNIKKLNKETKHLKLTCDNAVGQNKNNIALWLYSYLVINGYYQSIELNFMIAGHTKFKVDGNFGLIKRLYRKSTINSIDDFVKVIKNSSPAGLNKTQRYENGKCFQYFDFKVLERYFNKLPNLAKYHHFLFEASSPGIVKVQEFAHGGYEEFSLWKDPNNIAESIRDIRNLTFPILTPKPLSLERQKYLYQNIRPLVGEGIC